MKILAVDSTAKSASAAITVDMNIISECYSDAGLTHSKTLMPMVDSVFRASQTDISEIDIFAVSQGPGSFTGVRIGVAAIKGMASAVNKPCIGLSTLEILAWNFADMDCKVICVMDARCNQVYTATFGCKGKIKRLTEDEAITIPDLLKRFEGSEEKYFLAGDGAALVYSQADKNRFMLPPPLLQLQRASSVGLCAYNKIITDTAQPVCAAALVPSYLRLPQAERELKKKQQSDKVTQAILTTDNSCRPKQD